ncbi:hypothetical protein VTN00DRAFT_6990 [Thermoascus crustaceus]|uniref:uncharacterized protein n=1 Tax=Thermoascus crustaceus TaxID=5088 RepID=UPI003743B960
MNIDVDDYTQFNCPPVENCVEVYPDGHADTVGFWAESVIFSGVLLFDRGELEKERAAYIHSPRFFGRQYHSIFCLSDFQVGKFLTLFSSPQMTVTGSATISDGVECGGSDDLSALLPFQPEPDTHMIHPQDAQRLHMFQDKELFQFHGPPGMTHRRGGVDDPEAYSMLYAIKPQRAQIDVSFEWLEEWIRQAQDRAGRSKGT